jgi:recombination protein RecT
MAQLVRIDQRGKIIAQLFKENEKRLLSLAPRSTADAGRIFQVCFQHIAYNTDLLVCTQESLIAGVFEAIKLGITLGGPMQEGWLVPFKEHGTPKATLIVGYQGFRNIIDRGKGVADMHPRLVSKKDPNFEYWFGDQPRIIHKPPIHPVLTEEEVRAVYIIANLRGGGRQMEVLEKEEIDAHRAKSRTRDTGPWKQFYPAMALKTAVRKIAKYLPKSNELLARALQLDEDADLGRPQDIDVPPGTVIIDEHQPTQGSGSRLEALKQQLGASSETADDPGEERNQP